MSNLGAHNETSQSTKKEYFLGFDGLRALSVGLVLQSHLGVFENWIVFPGFSPGDPDDRIWPLIAGHTGVTVFFVLSGFLITSLLLRERETKGRISIKNFMIRRMLRLTPVLVSFVVVLAALMYLKLIPGSKLGLIFAATYIYNFLPNTAYTSELGHTWSLSVEEHFYLIWPWFVALLKRQWLILANLVLIGIVIFCNVTLPKLEGLNSSFHVERWTMVASGPILVGCLFALLRSIHRVRIESSSWWLLVTGFFACSLWLPLGLLHFHPLIQAIGIGFLLLWMVSHPTSWVVRLLEWAPLKYVGKMSYGVYIWQGLFLRGGPGPSEFAAQQFPYNIISTFAVASLSYHVLESRFLNLRSRFR